MSTEFNIRSTESYKTSTEVPKSFSKQEELIFEISVQPQSKLKVDRLKCQLKFEHFDLTRPNQDPTAEIQSEWLDKKY